MLTRPLHHLRQNLVAYIALFVALGGTSYAALNLPAGSVGARQLRNHAIDPVKFNPRLINGSIRAWAEVTADGRVIAGRGKPAVIVRRGSGSAGTYTVTWRVARFRRCLPVATVDGRSLQPGFADAELDGGSRIVVFAYSAQGQPAALPFNTFVIC